MTNLYEILQNAQGGQAMENLARQFNLSQQQTQAAVEALLPAFSMGLKRQAGDPAAAPNLFGLMGGVSPEAFQNPMAAFTQVQAQGNEVLGTLFGSKDASRAVADQAAALSGVGSAVLKAMLPVLAAMLMGGLQKTATTQPGLQDVFGQVLGGLFGGQAAPQAPQPTPQVQPNLNGGGLLGAILGSLLQQGVQQAQPAAPPPQAAPPSQPSPADVLGGMFETGRQMQQAHLDSLQTIFDSFLGKK